MEDKQAQLMCFIGTNLKNDKSLFDIAKTFELNIVYSDTGQEWFETKGILFIFEEFVGEVYKKIHGLGLRILSPIALKYYHKMREPLPLNCRPLYNLFFKDIGICFNVYHNKEVVHKLATLIHHMGGSIKKDFTSTKLTHLISNTSSGDKYRYAVSLGIPIMRDSWVTEMWNKRHDFSIKAINEEKNYRLPVFFGCKMGLIGFSEEEYKLIEEKALDHGGVILSHPNNEPCTHLIVEGLPKEDLTPWIGPKTHVVRAEWFWSSILLEAGAEESLYKSTYVDKRRLSVFLTPTRQSLSSSTNKRSGHKRKINDINDIYIKSGSDSDYRNGSDSKRRSSEMVCRSLSASILDQTFSPDNTAIMSPALIKLDLDIDNASPRQRIVIEMHSTESNYNDVLNTIMSIYQNAQTMKDLLEPEEMKTIFGKIPPIFELHKKLLKEIKNILSPWRDESGLGTILLSHVQEMKKVYPPFINFFEKTKDMVKHCEANKQRFHAFLKKQEYMPACARQPLVELLIRPVQRLPSLNLLLSDFLKKTPVTNPDHGSVKTALESLKEVMTHINENKRKTDSQVELFNIVNDIENSPALLLSSHRIFINKVDVEEIGGEQFGDQGVTLTLFLFSDMLEICKKRKTSAIFKSPIPNLIATKNRFRHYKHIQLVNLEHIKSVVNVVDDTEFSNIFMLVIQTHLEIESRYCKFVLQGDGNKGEYLDTLARQVQKTMCLPEMDFIREDMTAAEAGLKAQNLNNTKTMKFHKLIHKPSFAFKGPRATPNRKKYAADAELATTPVPDSSRPVLLSRTASESTTSTSRLKRLLSYTPSMRRRNQEGAMEQDSKNLLF